MHTTFKRLSLILMTLLLFSGGIKADVVGPVTPANSIIGSNANDKIGSGAIGSIFELPSGNIVIDSPLWNGSRGAVTCLTPAQYQAGGIVISAANSLVGSTANDRIGGGTGSPSVIVLTNGNYVVRSPSWNSNTGAVTWVDGTTCIPYGESSPGAVVSAANSLVGATAGDIIGNFSVVALPNGNYVVTSPGWNNSGTAGAGAVTWGNGNGGTVGPVSAANSLVGSSANDGIGGPYSPMTVMPNSNYVVRSPNWDNGAVANAGAITLGNGNGGTVGPVTSSNSLVGSSANDQLGAGVLIPASGNNFIVPSPSWDAVGAADVGAVTWVNGTTGLTGPISSANSLVGTTLGDQVGSVGVFVLSNGNYVVASPNWDNGATPNVGAATWCNGTTGRTGFVSAANSLIGSTADDQVAYWVTALKGNGNYVVQSQFWDNGGATNAGAVTWGSGASGITGTINSGNSLVGSATNDGVGGWYTGVTALTNGNYVVVAPGWDDGAVTDAGAAIWGNGTSGIKGTISSANALVGTKSDDSVGSSNITELTNGNYLVRSQAWDNGSAINAGAVTWVNGATGRTGSVSSANSLVGSSNSDNVGNDAPLVLTNGNYVVVAPNWANGGVASAGALTWGNGTTGSSGVISAANSLVGSNFGDSLGLAGTASPLKNGNYVVFTFGWDNGGTSNVGAVTWGNGSGGTVGTISASNSLVGSMANDKVGYAVPLANGNYVVIAPNWDDGGTADVGAAISGNGSGGTVGTVSASNALVGTTASDKVGYNIFALSNGDYLVISPFWDNGTTVDAGAITYSKATVPQPGVTITESGGTAVTEGGANDSYSIVLKSQPTDNVTITLSFGADLNVTSGTTLTFTPANWNTPQTVTVAAVDDNTFEGTEIATITHLVSSLDLNYHAIPVSDVSVTITDNDAVPTSTFTAVPSTMTPISPTETATTTGPTSTPTATPLPQGSVELLQNGGFEIAGASAGKPESWTLKKLSQDKRKCDSTTAIVSFQGSCAFIFRGAVLENAKLVQSANLSGYVFEEGDTLTYSLEYRTKGTSAPKLKLKLAVVFGDPLHPVKRSVTANIVNGVYSFVMTDYRFGADASTVTSIKAVIQNKTLTGKVFIDDASIVFDPLDDDPSN